LASRDPPQISASQQRAAGRRILQREGPEMLRIATASRAAARGPMEVAASDRCGD
jgi:hypothetical protein